MTSSGRCYCGCGPLGLVYPRGPTVTRSSSRVKRVRSPRSRPLSLPCGRDDRPRPGTSHPAQRRPEGRLAGRGRHMAHRLLRRSAGPGDPHVRRPRGRPWHVVVGSGVGLLPVRRGARCDVGSGAGRGGGPGPRARGALEGRQRRARPDREPPPHTDRRTQLRVLQRGPGPDRRDRGRLRPRAAARAGGSVHQALRRQRHRVRADDDLVGDRRAHAPRAVPRAVRGCRSPTPTSASSCPGTTASTARSAASTSGCSPSCSAASGASTDSSSATGSARTARRRRCSPVSTSRCPARLASAASTSAPRSTAARSASTISTGRWRACWRSPSGPVPLTRRTAETTDDDPETRSVIRRATARAMVLLKNDDRLLPLASDVRRIALIGPYARHGRPQGGGSARVQPNHGRGPLEALQARGVDVTFEPGGSIAKYLPTVRGDFTVTLDDESGATARDRGQPAGVVLGQVAGRGHRPQRRSPPGSPARSCPR